MDTDEVTAYVDAVRVALTGLPDAIRDELLEDLPEHLAEVAADDIGTLTERLGPPSVYAAELLASAGFVGGFPDPPPPVDHLAALRATALRRLRVVDAKAGPLFGYPCASDFLTMLRPAWWVLRGYLAAMVLAWMLDDSGQPIGLLPRIGGSELVALLLLAAGVLSSIWLGRRSAGLAHWPRYALYAGSTVLVLVALGGFLSADSSSRGAHYSPVSYDNPYSHVEDVFVYDEQGQLVEGARLFDQYGQPIKLGVPLCDDAEQDVEVETAVSRAGYPYCPAHAPFRMPVAPGSETRPLPTEPADPGPADPGPTASASISPSASVRVSPSASVAASQITGG